MASARPPRTTTLCGRCGAYLPVALGARSVRCGLCHAVTRVERRQHGLHHAAVGFFKGLISAIVSPTPTQQQPTPSSWPSSAGAASQQLPASYPRVARGCRKRALLVGISYAGTKYELKGAVNDAHCMELLLRQRFGFPSDCILVMTQDDKDPYRVPTKGNLRLAMRWLVEGTGPGDSLVFHFSGHGVQKLDKDGDEADGYDEALCPVDFEDRGVILDDEINAAIVRPLGPGVKLHAIVDTCHSGTVLDLPYLCRISRIGYWQWENHSRPSGEPKCTSGGLAISISGCGDSQTSQDTTEGDCNCPLLSAGVLGVHLDRRHDVQLHQGSGVGAGHHLRPPADGDAGDHPRQRRGVRHPRAHRHILPTGHHLQLRAGAPAVRFGTVRHLQEAFSLVIDLQCQLCSIHERSSLWLIQFVGVFFCLLSVTLASGVRVNKLTACCVLGDCHSFFLLLPTIKE